MYHSKRYLLDSLDSCMAPPIPIMNDDGLSSCFLSFCVDINKTAISSLFFTGFYFIAFYSFWQACIFLFFIYPKP